MRLSARAWHAAGVRHELLKRVFPAVIHDMSAPLSLMRMQLMLLRRRGVEQGAESLDRLEAQVGEVAHSARSLATWEWPPRQIRQAALAFTRASLVTHVSGFLRVPFELSGMQLVLSEQFQSEGPEAAVFDWRQSVSLRYAVLGALCHVRDMHAHLATGGRIAVDPVSDWGLSVRPMGPADGAPPQFDADPGNGCAAIDLPSLQALYEELGCRWEISPDGGVLLDLRLPA